MDHSALDPRPPSEVELRPRPLRPVANLGALLGAVAFVAAVFLPPPEVPGSDPTAVKIGLLLAALALMLASLWSTARRERRDWVRLVGRCVEHSLERDSDSDGGYSWAVRLVCEFELAGLHHRTRVGYWCTFPTQGLAKRFLRKAVLRPEGCPLWVNPRDPRQAELAGGGIADWLLHRRPR